MSDSLAKTPPLIPAGVYALDRRRSVVTVRAARGLFAGVAVSFRSIQGELTYDPDTAPISQRLSLKVNPRSATTGNAMLDAMVRGDQFLDAERFPAIRFISREVHTPAGDGRGQGKVVGELDLHGTSRPVTFDIVFAGEPGLDCDGCLRVRASTVIDRRDFGMSRMRAMVSDHVRFQIEAVLAPG